MNKEIKDPRIEVIMPKIIVGKRVQLTLLENGVKTKELWQQFMPRRNSIFQTVNTNLLSVQIYPDTVAFNKDMVFEKWAAVEVSHLNVIPDGMESYTLQGGLYAVFIYKGIAADFMNTYQLIFSEWLPNSPYIFDNREQFEVMDEHYRPDDPQATEEVWIPIKAKE